MSQLSRQLKLEKAKIFYIGLQKSSKRVKEAIDKPLTVFNRDASIKRFEFCFEVTWKLIKTLIEIEGLKIASPKAAIRQAAAINLIDDPQKWFNFLDNRNLTVHMYQEKVAEKVYPEIKKFYQAVVQLIPKVKKLLDTEK